MAHEDEITTLEMGGLLDGTNIGRGFHHAEQAAISFGIGTQWADIGFAKGTALSAITHLFYGLVERTGKAFRSFAVMFQKVECHTLG